MKDNAIPQAEIRSELERILASPLFLQSERLARFLRYTVEQTLQGEQASLKEIVIGMEVYDRKPPYNPGQDSIVRTEARRLRSKLKEYYEGEGRDNPVYIYFRPGSYVPVFRMRSSLEGSRMPRHEGIPIAVLPFVALSEGALATSLALGLGDELVHALMRTDGCRVVAAGSIDQLLTQAADIPTLAHRLGAHVVFDGTVQHVVQQAGARIRIHARLVDAEGTRIWSQRFEVSAAAHDGLGADLFEIQERVISSLMTRTAPRLSAVRAGAGLPPPEQMRYYPDLLAAEELLEEGTLADLPRALQAFRRIVTDSPEYARAHVGLAQTLIWISQRGVPDAARLVTEAQQAAETAFHLDSGYAEAHSALATAFALQWHWTEAEMAFRRALELGRSPAVMRQYAAFLVSRGRFDEARSYFLECRKLDAFSHRLKAAGTHFLFLSRQYQEALDYCHDSLRYGTVPAEVCGLQSLILLQLGRYEEALTVSQTLRRGFGQGALLDATVVEVLAAAGQREAALTLRDTLIRSEPPVLNAFRFATLALALGEENKALDLLETAANNRAPELPWAAVDPRFDSLRQNGRFQAILTRIG